MGGGGMGRYWGGYGGGGSMVGSDRLNVPAIDTFSHSPAVLRLCTFDTCPLLGWGAPLSMNRARRAVSAVGHACTGSPPAAVQTSSVTILCRPPTVSCMLLLWGRYWRGMGGWFTRETIRPELWRRNGHRIRLRCLTMPERILRVTTIAKHPPPPEVLKVFVVAKPIRGWWPTRSTNSRDPCFIGFGATRRSVWVAYPAIRPGSATRPGNAEGATGGFSRWYISFFHTMVTLVWRGGIQGG